MGDLRIPGPYIYLKASYSDVGLRAQVNLTIPGPIDIDLPDLSWVRREVKKGMNQSLYFANEKFLALVMSELAILKNDIEAQLELIAMLPDSMRKRVAYELFSAAFDHYLPKKFIYHYIWGDGAPMHLTLQQMMDCNPYINLQSTKSFRDAQARAKLNEGRPTPIDLNIRSGALTNGTLGQFTTKIKAVLTATGDAAWKVNGTMHFYDEWDFDPKDFSTGGRSFQGEVKTRIANVLLPGKGFKITSETTEFSQSQADKTVIWKGGKPKGVPDRIAAMDFELSQADR